MILMALVLFAVAGLLLAWAEDRLQRRSRSPLAWNWFEQFLLPLGRVFALMLFIVCAYPALYGLNGREAPAFGALLAAGNGRLDRLINVLFFVGLLLPAIPGLRRWIAVLLPLQGMAGVALVASWLAAAQGVSLTLWPSAAVWSLLVIVAGLAALLARLMTALIDDPVLRQDAHDLLLLWLQAPLLLIYAMALGRALR